MSENFLKWSATINKRRRLQIRCGKCFSFKYIANVALASLVLGFISTAIRLATYGIPEVIFRLSVESVFFGAYFLLASYVFMYFGLFLGIELIHKMALMLEIDFMTRDIRRLTPHGWGHEKEMI